MAASDIGPASDIGLELISAGAARIEGWRLERACLECGGETVYYLDYAATCCLRCNRWITLHCPDPDCDQCRCRPERPLTG
jgi:hypothetical protein